MRFAIAEEASNLGADVTLISSTVNLELKNNKTKQIKIITAEEMYQATHKYFVDADIVIKAAAVADYRPKLSHEEKLKKTDDNQVFEMERTKDILKSLGDRSEERRVGKECR